VIENKKIEGISFLFNRNFLVYIIMKIATKHYQLEFPKYAKKIRTKIIPESVSDKKRISQLLRQANIKFKYQTDETIGIYGKHFDLVDKLKAFLQRASPVKEDYNHVAKRLCSDMQFRALLG